MGRGLWRSGIAAMATLGFTGAACAQSAAVNADTAVAQLGQGQPDVCPVEGSLRLPAPESLERFVSLRKCRGRAVIAPPRQIPHRLEPVIIQGVAEKAPATDDAQADQPKAAAPDSDRTAATGGMLASLTPASLMVQLSSPAAMLSTDKPSVAAVRIIPLRSEMTPHTLAALASAQLVAAKPDEGIAGDTILALAPRSYATRFDRLIADAAWRHAIDPLLLHAVVQQESGYGAHAVSRAGAVGLMQIMPATGARFGQPHGALFDPARNLDTGARLLRTLHARYGGNIDLMLAAYNAGEGAVSRYGNRVPPFRETRDYVQRVKARYVTLASENGLAGLSL